MSENVIIPYIELRKMLLIINPVSGRKTSIRYLPEIIRIFNDGGWAVTVFMTKMRGDATQYAKLYADKFDAVTCIGGDGTLNETVCGLILNGSNIPIGYIPAGSTNDFAASHGISTNPECAARAIVGGKVTQLDIGSFGERNFTYIAAFGAFSWLSYTTSQSRKNVLGHSAYIIDAVMDLSKIKSESLCFETEDFACEGRYIFGAICNCTSIAGTITIPKDIVNTSDGKFEIILIHEPNTVSDFQSIIAGLLNHDYSSPFIDFFQTSSLKITAPDSLEWSLDGERYIGKSPIYVNNIQNGLMLLGL